MASIFYASRGNQAICPRFIPSHLRRISTENSDVHAKKMASVDTRVDRFLLEKPPFFGLVYSSFSLILKEEEGRKGGGICCFWGVFRTKRRQRGMCRQDIIHGPF